MKKTKSLSIALLMAVLTISVMGVNAQETYKKVDVKAIDPTYFVKDRFKDKVIIVTGGARGIGQATAIRAAREGAKVVIADWLEKEGTETLNMIKKEGLEATFILTDIRSSKDCDNLVTKTVAKYGKIDYALLNAGVMDGAKSDLPLDLEKQKNIMPNNIHLATDEYWNNIMDINAGGTFKSMRSILMQLLKQGNGGAIVCVGSIAGMTGLAGNPAYVASKHAVNGLVKTAALDYAQYGIRVNSVNMAATATPMVAKATEYVMAKRAASGGSGDGLMGGGKGQSILAMNDSKHRDATPWEQAAPILFLLSDDASNLTGGIYATDGGWTAY